MVYAEQLLELIGDAKILGAELDLWNKAILDVFYSQASAGQMAYLDLDEDNVEHLQKQAGGQPIEAMIKAVRDRINLQGAFDYMLDEYRNATNAWFERFKRSNDFDETPPMLAFLAVTVLAAEKMGEGDANANAYYEHLHDVLGIPGEPKRVRTELEKAYREEVVYFWSTFNHWLSAQDGQRGFPTAYAISQPYASIPQSQALLRAKDRSKLPHFFDHFRLAAGSIIDSDDIVTMFEAWLVRDSANVTTGLKKLWAKDSAKHKIAEQIADELSSWNGTLPDNSKRLHSQDNKIENRSAAQRLYLLLAMHNRLGVKKLKCNLAVNGPNSLDGDFPTLRLDNLSGELDLTFISESLLALADWDAFDLSTIASSTVSGAISGIGPVRREPHQLVVLVIDENTGYFKETSRVGLGQDSYVLAKNHGGFADEIASFLEKHARPGYEKHSENDLGLPSGWTLFTNVQVSGSASDEKQSKFEALVPLAKTQLHLSGGVRLPSYKSQTKWLTSRPPEIRAISRTGKQVAIEIRHLNQLEGKASPLRRFESNTGEIFQSLENSSLADGEYRVDLLEGGKSTQYRRMVLKSSSSPDAASKFAAQDLAHVPSIQGQKFIFSSVPRNGQNEYLVGAISSIPSQNRRFKLLAEASRINWLPEDESKYPRKKIALPQTDSDSCVFTGDHKKEEPRPFPGQKSVIWKCENCGIEGIVYHHWGVRSKIVAETRDAEGNDHEVRLVAAPARVHSSIDWLSIRAVLGHSVGGKVSTLKGTLAALTGPATTAGQILDGIEQLGLIEVSRDSTGRELDWRLTDAQLVQPTMNSKHIFILGAPAPSVIVELKSHEHEWGIKVIEEEEKPLIRIAYEDQARLASISSLTGMPLVLDAAMTIAKSLPPLSSYIDSAKPVAIHSVDIIDRFDFDSGKWVSTDGVPEGAIRSGHAGRLAYYFVTQESRFESQGIPGSATLVKYLAANASGVSMLSHNKELQSAIVPLGARVPGLYARPLLLCSGELDSVEYLKSKDGAPSRRAHSYSTVPAEVSDLVANLLRN